MDYNYEIQVKKKNGEYRQLKEKEVEILEEICEIVEVPCFSARGYFFSKKRPYEFQQEYEEAAEEFKAKTGKDLSLALFPVNLSLDEQEQIKKEWDEYIKRRLDEAK